MMRANYTRRQLAQFLGVQVQTLAAWACRGRGPRFWKRRNRVLYRGGDVAAWLDNAAAYEAVRATHDDACGNSCEHQRESSK
jgi:hypothetical protein